MKRQLALLEHAIGGLLRRRGRNGSIIVGMWLVVGLFSAVLFLTDALRREFSVGIEATPDLTVQRMVGGRPALIDADAVSALAERRGIRSVDPRVWGYLYVPSLAANLTIVGWRPTEIRQELRHDVDSLLEGRLPEATGEMAIGETLARQLGLRVDDEMAFPKPGGFHLLRVVGIFESESVLRSADILFTSETDARTLLGVPADMATDVAVWLGNPAEGPVVTERIAELSPGYRILERPLLARTYTLTFDERGGLMAATMLPALIALFLLAWERLSGIGEDERREIGTLKAIGWETRDILTARMWESGLVAYLGTGGGLIAGYFFVFVLDAPFLSDAIFGWSALYPPLELVPAVDAAQVFTLLGAVVIPFVGVSIVPAWRAATIDPDTAMRGL